jgi:hypothetical protein
MEAFRGIRNSIDLPLDASITILLAANGTAKTSVCDAAEWLLTGRVRRIQPGLISPDAIRSRYAGNARALVQATATWKGSTREIERTECESLQIPTTRGVSRKATTTGKFLEQLTPEYVGQTARSRNVEEQRAEWLRAVRFFSPDGLSLLLDDSEDAERVRGLAFAELLGVGPVGRRIEGLKGVRAQIDSPRAEIKNVLEKIATYEARLKEHQTSVSAPYLARVDALLREIARFFEVELPETLAIRREALLSMRDRLASAERALEVQRTEYAKVSRSIAQYEKARAAWKKWLDEQKPALDKTANETKNEREQASQNIRQLTTQASELTRQLGQLNVLLGQTQTAIASARLEASAHDASGTFAVAQTRAQCDDAKKKHKESHVQLEQWKKFAEEFPQGQRVYVQLDLLAKQRLELSQAIPSAEDQAAVERRLRESNLSLTQLREQINTSTDQWQRWGAEVRAHSSNWRAKSICPLCGHDHRSPELLRSAIDEVLSKQPSAAPETATRLAQLESSVAELRASAVVVAERRRQFLELEQNIAVQKATFERFLAVAQERGFDEQLFRRVDASTVVGSRLRAAEETSAETSKLAERLLVLASDVERWHSELRGAAQELRAALPEQPEPADSLPSDPSLEQRIQEVEGLLAFAQKHTETLRDQSERASRSTEEMRAKLAKLDATLQQQQEVLEPLGKNAEQAKRFIDDVEESWGAISGEPLKSTSLTGAAAFQQKRSQQLREQADRLKQAEQHLNLAEQATRVEVDQSEASKAIATNRAEHAALLRVDLLRTKLDSAIDEAEKHLNRLLSTQIRPLLCAISSLYLRTQGNPFIDSIGVDDNSTRNVLRWLGKLADAQPLSTVEMSQGQRQDLALSIFLARARREKGTFILDEPLAHLDDLNRVAFFDTLRAMVAETEPQTEPFRLVLTTASSSLVRHLRAKFLHLREVNGSRALRVIELVGDPRSGIEVLNPT